MSRIVILGAGYSGMTAAVSLAARTRRRPDVHITVVNAEERFTERLRLHQVASGQQLSDLRISEMLRGTRVEFVRGWVTAIDVTARVVRLDDERELAYDTLVYALGAVADTEAVPGADHNAFVLNGQQDAALLGQRLTGLRTGTVVVCGSGLTGVEAAAEIAERHPALDVVLLGSREPGATLGPGARAYLQAALRLLRVQVRSAVEIVKVAPDAVHLSDGSTVPADAVLWTVGVRISPLAATAGLRVDERGRIVTDSTLRSVSHPEVYAIGDAGAIRQSYGLMHGTCQSGMPTGVHAATSIARQLRGQAPRAFRFGYLHAPVSLGRRDAVIQLTHPDDSPKRLYLTGRPAVWYKETVSSSPWPSFRRLKRRPGIGAFAWRRGGRFTR